MNGRFFLIEDFFGENPDLWIYLKYGRFGHLGYTSLGRQQLELRYDHLAEAQGCGLRFLLLLAVGIQDSWVGLWSPEHTRERVGV